MRPDQPRGTARAEFGREIAKLRNADALRARRRRLALEALEARTLMAVLPAPTVTGQSDVSAISGALSSASNASSPVISVDPTNPLNLAAVWTVSDPDTFEGNGFTTAYVDGATSDDGGVTWNAFGATPGVDGDPSNNGNPFAQVTDGSVAWDRSGNIYVAETQHSTSNIAGELDMFKFSVAAGVATETTATQVTTWQQGTTGAGQTEVFNPTIAVDDSVASFTDPDTGKTQTDSSAGDVYIVETDENALPSGFTGDWNPLTTGLWTSTDGGTTFPNDLTGFDGLGLGNVGPQREAAPKITISQGTVDGSVAGGTVTLVWDDFGVFSGASPLPLDAIVDQQVVGGGSTTLTGAALVQTTIVRDDPGANYGSGSPTTPPTAHSVATDADAFGIAPSPAIASDNTLGSFSQFQGRIYVTYTDRYDENRTDDLVTGTAAAGNPADNTDIFMTFLDPTTGAWSTPVQVNDDTSTVDGYSDAFTNTVSGPITGRPQFESQVAVDNTTGTVAVSFLDTRYDAATARVATTLTTSIDGGTSFSPQNMAFADAPNQVFDAISQTTDTLGPIPENQSSGNTRVDTVFSYGDHQGLAFEDGHLYPAFAGNFNGGATGTQLMDLIVSPSTTSAGPRIVSATMGPVGEPGDRINTEKNADGSPIANAFEVTFDRPVDPSTFNTLPTQTAATFLDATFDDGTTDNFVINNTPDASDPNYRAGLWHVSTGRGADTGHSASDSLYYGSGETAAGGGNYVGTAGFANAGTVTSPAINLPANKFLELTFNYFLQTEHAGPGFDFASVNIIDMTNPSKSADVDDNTVGSGKLLDQNTSNAFDQATINLSSFAGDTIKVQFSFDTQDSLNNDFEGWYLDDVDVFQPALTADVQIQARTALGVLLTTQPVITGVTPLDSGAFGATQFLVTFAFPNGFVPPEAATYSYSVGPDISDRIRTISPTTGTTIDGNNMDQNGNAVTGETSRTAGENDAFSNPESTTGVPFVLPYVTTTLPLITPGPHIAAAEVYQADGTPTGSTTLTTPVPIAAATTSGAVTVNSAATSPLTIGGDTDLQVTNLAVTLSITIPDTTDLIVSLLGPDAVIDSAGNLISGTEVVLSQQNPAPPASGANFTDTTFEDSSDNPIAGGNPPYDAVFKPDSPLSAFNGHDVAGEWRLLVMNTSTTDTGEILGWSLQVSSEAVALDHPLTEIPIVFDRNMNPATLTAASVLAINGPDGVIAGPYNIIAAPDLDPLHPDPDASHPRTYLVTFPAQTSSGSFSVVLASSIQSEAGDEIDENLNAGLTALRGDPTGTNVAVKYTSPAATTISPGVTDSTITVPATDTYAIQTGVTLQLNITYPNDPDLTAVLIAPADDIDPATGNPYRITLFSGVGATGTHANFSNTIFSDTAPTPIQQGGPSFASATGFNPQEPLDIHLVGQMAAGTYTLEITNSSTNRSGTLTYWNLTFNKTVPTAGLGEPVADQTTIPFRVFNLDPTSSASSTSWTAVGPAGIAAVEGADTNGQTAGRVSAIAVDPSDPSGNTVYAGGASGGVWKTTDFLTTSPEGPTWRPLTDFGAAFAANIGSIAIFPRNGDPNQSVIYAATGEGDALGDPTQTAEAKGIGILRSMDGGQTWTLLDSTNNNLPFTSASSTIPARDHLFALGQGTSSYKITVDPKAGVNGGIIVFMAISDVDGSGNAGGIWRSTDSGETWTKVLAGQATDIVADLNSGTGVSGGNLQSYNAAIEGEGVFSTTNQGQSWILMTGGVGDPLIQQGTRPSQPVPVAAPLGTPNGAKGRIVLARPALTTSAVENVQYQGWLYAAVIAAPGNNVFSTSEQLDGLYMTKDFGQNWVKVTLPTDAGLPTNDNTDDGNVQLTGSTTPAGTSFGLGNFDLTLAVDPNNPNVVYLGGTNQFGTTGLLRVDTTGINDAHSFYSDQDLADGGKLASSVAGGISEQNPALAPPLIQPPYASNPTALGGSATINLLRDPTQPFVVGATVKVTNAGTFSNTGANVSWIPFDQALQPDPFDTNATDAQAIPTRGQHQIVAIPDALTGGTRLIFADDQGIYSVVAGSTGSLIGSIGGLDTSVAGALNTDQGDTPVVSGSRNGDLQIAQLYSAAVQPSNEAAASATLPGFFYGNTSENGQPQSDPNEVNNSAAGTGYGNLSWAGDSASAGNPTANYAQGSGTGVGIDETAPSSSDPTGLGSVYQFKWPISLVDESLPPTDFLQYNGLSRTNGLLQASDNGDVPDPEWPFRTGSNFAVNPIDGEQVIISSQSGQIFRTENDGEFWSIIGQPSALDGSYAPALAFGAPETTGTGNLDDFLYAGTEDGNIFVTQTGGGGIGNNWSDISTGLDGSPVEQIVTDPTRGTHDAYAVTAGGSTVSVPNDPVPPPPPGGQPENVLDATQTTAFETVTIPNDVDVSHLSVTVNVNFNDDTKLTLELVAPNGTVLPLVSDVSITTGGANPPPENFINTTFDDQSTTPIYSGTAPFTNGAAPLLASYAPGLLVNGAFTKTYITDRYHLASDFYGEDIVGKWTLVAISGNNADSGQINNFSLNYTTLGGVYYNADTIDGDPWQNLSGNLYRFTTASFGDSTEADTVARSLTSIVADWRYAIPDSLSDPTGAAHPILYVAGDSGVFQSIDGGTTWTMFPASGGGLPEVDVTTLGITYGDINSTTGRPVASSTDPDLLTASTYGRGEFAIELTPIVLASSIVLDPNTPTSELPAITGVGSDTGSNLTDKLTADRNPVIDGYSQETAFGSTVTINIVDETVGTPGYGLVVGTGTTDGSGAFAVKLTGGTAGTNALVPTSPAQFGNLITLAIEAVAPNGAIGTSVPFSFTLDVTTPATPPKPVLAPASDSGTKGDDITNVIDPTFNISNVESGAELQLFRNGALVNTIINVGVVATGATVAIQDPGPAQPDGQYSYTVEQTDLAGNVGSISAAQIVTILTATPATLNAPDLVSAGPNLSDSGRSPTDNYTNDTAPFFTITVASVGDTVELFRNGTLVNSLVATASTVTIRDPGPVQPDGTYTYTAEQIDVAGNQSAMSPGLPVTIDTTPPIAPTNLKLDPASDSGTKGDGVTNINNPFYDLSGIEVNATVYLERKVAGAADSTYVVVNTGGTFTTTGGTLMIQDPGPLANGNYVYRAYQVDLAGNVGAFSSTIAIRILSGAPAIPGPLMLDASTDTGYGPPSDPTRSDDTTSATLIRFPVIDVFGIVAGSTVILYRNGVQVNSVVSSAGGEVMIPDPSQPYNDGTYIYTAKQVDASGDTSGISGGLPVTFDNTAPVAPSAPALEPGSDSGTIGDRITNDTSPIFDVSGLESNAELELLRDGVVVSTILHVAGGTVAIQDAGPVPQGVHTYQAIQVDEAGNTSPIGGSTQVTVLTTGPTFTPGTPILTAASDSGASNADDVTNVTSPVLSLASVQAGVTVQLLRFSNGTGVVVGSRVGPGTIQDPGPLQPGYYGYEAREVDAAGNVGPASAMLTILVVGPATAPPAPMLSAASDSGTVGDGITNVTHPVFNLTATGPASISPAATITLFRNGVLVGSRTGSGPITDNGLSGTGLAAGTYIYTAIETDLAGNVSTASPMTTVTIITSIAAPGTPVLASPPGGSYTNVTHPIINIPTAPSGATVLLFRNNLLVGSRVGAGTITDNGSTGSGLPPGTYTYTAYAEDVAGNISVASGALVLTIATSLPAAPPPVLDPSTDSGTAGDGITNVNKPLFDITAANAQITSILSRKPTGAPNSAFVTVGTRLGTGTIQDLGSGSGLADGSYTYIVTQTDPAGNISPSSTSFTVVIRTTPPVATAAPTLDPSSDSSPGHGGTNTNVTSPYFDVTGSTPGSPVTVAVVLYRKPAGSADSAYVVVNGVAAAAGTVRIQDAGPLAAGSYTYATRQVDIAGNVGPLSVSKTINILVSRPATPSIQISRNSDLGFSVGLNVTSSRNPVFTGTGQAGSTIVLLNAVSGALIGTAATSTVNGSYSITTATPINETLQVQAFAVDAAGNTSVTPASLTIRIATVTNDYNGDGKADLASFTPGTGTTGAFNLATSSTGTASVPFGKPGDIPISGDFDGDGKTDIGVYRPSTGQWIIQESTAGLQTISFGTPGVSIPVPGDYDGDGKTDLGIYNPSSGQWTILKSTTGVELVSLGTTGDIPVQADYDGDGKTDVAVYRPSTGQWIIQRTTAGFEVVTLGAPTDEPIPADYDGDGKADIAVYRPSTGQWIIQQSTAGPEVVSFGAPGDIPVPSDYDGDGKADLALFRPSTAQWIIIQSTAGARIQTSGNVNDIPVAAPYIARAGSLGLQSVSSDTILGQDVILGSTGLDLGASASAFGASPTVGSTLASTTTTTPTTAKERLALLRTERAEKLAEIREDRQAAADARHHDHALESILSGTGVRRPKA